MNEAWRGFADRKQVSYHLIVILLTALAQYRGTS
jgi:hypothetical protein